MVHIKVKYFGKIRTVTRKLEEEIVFSGKTIRDLIDYLIDIYGEKLGRMILKNNKLANDIIILINGQSVGNNLQKELNDGDVISILPFVSGG